MQPAGDGYRVPCAGGNDSKGVLPNNVMRRAGDQCISVYICVCRCLKSPIVSVGWKATEYDSHLFNTNKTKHACMEESEFIFLSFLFRLYLEFVTSPWLLWC